MSFIITGDFQAEFNNLDLCDQAWNDVLRQCKKRNLKLIAYLGDGKQAYNPVDIEVIKWWQGAIRKAKKRGIKVLYVLGNHDRVGQYTDARNWLPILKRVGAITFDKPGIYDTGNERLFILPFCNTRKAKEGADYLVSKNPDKEKDILLFHHDILGAKYNRQGSESDVNLSTDDLHCARYRCNVSGHIHFPQRLQANSGKHKGTWVYYVGSPFCHDWGEVNQCKRYLVVRKNEIRSITTSIPGWFDPSTAGFQRTKPKSWKGTRIRIRVLCSSGEDYGRRLDRARKEAERKYRGATIYIVPKFKDEELKNAIITTDDSDEKKLNEYVRASGQTKFRGSEVKKLISYMCNRVGRFGNGLRGSASSFTFKEAKGKNFLSYNKVKIDWTKKGIIVVQGVNNDRSVDCSNGSGKTSLFQLLPVALFGKNFKNQKSDAWANRWRKGLATAVVVGKTAIGDRIKITRGRRPPLLKLEVNGKDKSSGMKSNEKTGTQSLIEQVTGFTWETLANAVYIDRQVADAFLSGTKRQRTEVLSRFQNLERFDSALKLVRNDIKNNREELQNISERVERTRGSIEESRNALHEMRKIRDLQITGAYKEYIKTKKKLKEWKERNSKRIKILIHQESKLEAAYNKAVKDESNASKEIGILEAKLMSVLRDKSKLKKITSKQYCPLCLQDVDDHWMKERHKSLRKKADKLSTTLNKATKDRVKLRVKVSTYEGKHDEVESKLSVLDRERNTLSAFVETTHEQYLELASSKHSSSGIIGKAKNKLHEFKHKLHSLKEEKVKVNAKFKMLEFASEAFSREGIPAFLNRQLCPVLNTASEYYSGLFCDNDIQVKFIIDDKGEFVPNVINSKGGEGIDDQSTGERALAGLIASFALREVAPKTNILILDEPGEGLDMQSARKFARALQQLKSKFCTIYIASHNSAILSELSGERTVTVIKKDKISRLRSGD